jgi:hypothetical protein
MTLEKGNIANGDTYTLSNISPGTFVASSGVTSKCRITFPSLVTVTSCSITTTGFTVVLSLGTIANTLIFLEVDNFINPPSTATINNILVTRNTALESGLGTLNNVKPDTLASVSMAPYDSTSNFIGQTLATVKISFTTTNILPSNGKIKVTFPKWNPFDTNT